MKRLLLLLMVITAVMAAGERRVKTTRAGLVTDQSGAVPSIEGVALPDTSLVDQPDYLPAVKASDITLRGYSKRAGDDKESVFVTNNTEFSISAVHLLLRYRTTDGTLITERDVTLRVQLAPGAASACEFRSFDRHHEFYYIGSGRSRKSATPYDVSYRLLGYDITLGRRHSH